MTTDGEDFRLSRDDGWVAREKCDMEMKPGNDADNRIGQLESVIHLKSLATVTVTWIRDSEVIQKFLEPSPPTHAKVSLYATG